MKAGEICMRNVVTIEGNASIAEAARKMKDYHVGSLVIVDEADGMGSPLGIITDRDIVVGAVAQDVEFPLSLKVRDVVIEDLVLAREEEEVWGIIRKMRALGIRRLPVVNERDELVGILSMDDILTLLSEEFADISRIFFNERKKEIQTRG